MLPWIILSTKRSGSRTLRQLLAKISSDYPLAEDEPFNPGGQFCGTPVWEIAPKRWLIKHAYEWFENDFNRLLINEAQGHGYRFIHLLRRDNVARLVSLHFERAGAWHRSATDEVLRRAREGLAAPLNVHLLMAWQLEAEKKKREIDRILRKSMRGITVWYEDLFVGTERSKLANLCSIADFLEIDRKRVYLLRGWQLQMGAQDSQRVHPYLPNLNELRIALRDSGFGA